MRGGDFRSEDMVTSLMSYSETRSGRNVPGLISFGRKTQDFVWRAAVEYEPGRNRMRRMNN